MVDYVKVATNTNLAAAGAWTPGGGPPASVTNDTATWNVTSLGPSLTGNISTRKVTVNGATNNIVHSGTITLGADGFEFAPTNNRGWQQTGVVAVGASNQTWRLNNAGLGMLLSAAGGLTGSAVVLITNNSTSQSYSNAYITFTGACTGFTGTIELSDKVVLYTNNATGALTACNVLVSGNANVAPIASGQVLGSAAKTLTFNANAVLGEAGRDSFTIAYAVALGSVTRTLTVGGNATMSGTVTGTAGVTVAGGTQYAYLYFSGTSSGLTGALAITQGELWLAAANRYAPTSIDLGTLARIQYPLETADSTFATPLSGTGTVCIGGNFAGNGVTFPASPASGNIDAFAGTVQARAVTSATTSTPKIRISELPGGLSWAAFASAASPAMTALITYTGIGHTKATTVTLDSEGSANTASLTAGTYSLLSSGSGPLVLSGSVQRTNSNGGVTPLVTSARMSLTLGGSNTANNTLSGDISEVGTNSAILGITKVDAGRWVLSGANSSHTGIHTVSAGTLSAQSANALGSATSAGGVTISGTGVLELAGGITLNKSSTAFTIHQTSPITSVGDNTVETAGITLGGTTTFDVTTGNRLAISNSGAISDGASTFGVTKTGDGELALAAFANTYDGAVTVTAGTLAIGSVGALGTGVATVQLTGNLKYTGSGETLSRATQLNGSAPSFEASGSGALTVSNLSTSVSTKTLTLKGSNTGANTVTSSLTDYSGILSLAKEGAGTWVVTSRTYSGTTAVNAGTLRCESTNSATTTGAVTIGASGTVELVTDTLASSGAGNGEVLGTGNVTCNGGTIKTRGGTTQKGQVRYGGNLTFGAGSSLYIGAAA
jgi:autotransporter-associated beta strand protein